MPPNYIRVRAVVWVYSRGQTQTCVTTIHFASSTTHAKCNQRSTHTLQWTLFKDRFHHFHSMLQQLNPSIRSTLHRITFPFVNWQYHTWLPILWNATFFHNTITFHRWTHSPSRLAWSEGWRPNGAQSAFIRWTGWTLAVTMVMRTAP